MKKNILYNLYERMLLIRLVEEKIANNYDQKKMRCPTHLSVGQEAVSVAISQYLNNKDMVFGAHRSHAHILSLGINLKEFFAEILAKSSGVSKGMGGSMHLYGGSVGFCGSVPIVAGVKSAAKADEDPPDEPPGTN